MFLSYFFCSIICCKTNILADPHDCGFGARDQYTPPTDTSQNIQQLRVAIKKSSGVFFLGVQQYNSTGTFQLQIFPSTSFFHFLVFISPVLLFFLRSED
jgi:hypothetical protein